MVKTEFGAVDRGLASTTETVAQKAAKLDEEYKSMAKNVRNWEQAALRAVQSSLNNEQKLLLLREQLNMSVEQGTITQKQANQALEHRKRELTGVAQKERENARIARQAVLANMNATEKQIRLEKILASEVKRGTITQEERIRTIHRTREALAQQGSTARQTSGGFSAGIASTIKAYAGLHIAISTATKLLNEQQQAQEGAVLRTQDIATAISRLDRKMADFNDSERRQVLEGLQDLFQRFPTAGRAEIINLASQTIGATQGNVAGRIDELFASLSATIPLFIGELERGSGFSESLLDLKPIFDKVGLDMSAASAALLQAASQARITSDENIKNLVPALAAISVDAGDRLELEDVTAGFAFQAALGSVIADASGEITRTATSKLQETLNENLPNITGFADRLEFLFQDTPVSRRIAAEIAEVLEGKSVSKPAIRDILLGLTGTGRSNFLDIFQNFKIDPALQQQLAERIAGGTPEQALFSELLTRTNIANEKDRLRFQEAGFGAESFKQSVRRQNLGARIGLPLSVDVIETLGEIVGVEGLGLRFGQLMAGSLAAGAGALGLRDESANSLRAITELQKMRKLLGKPGKQPPSEPEVP